MNWENLIRDVIEVMMVVAVGGILWSSISRLRKGQVSVYQCTDCERPISRTYAACPKCGASQISAQ